MATSVCTFLQQVKMTSLEVFNMFNEQLVISLPMKDFLFLAKLNSKSLFSGDLKAQVKSKPTSTEAADYFLDNKIAIDLSNSDNSSFLLLLKAMEEFNSTLKRLATKIKDLLGVEKPIHTSNMEECTG